MASLYCSMELVVGVVIIILMIGLPDISEVQNQTFVTQRLAEIDFLLQHNFMVINQLEQRINSLVELNEKIAGELAITTLEPQKNKCLFEASSPEEKFIQRIFLKTQFNFFLSLAEPLKKPLFKDRNFNIHVGLYGLDHTLIQNSNSIPLQLSVYQSSEAAEQIETNKQGKAILGGNAEVQLMEGSAVFQKISIRQVSSKFQRGLVNLVIYVKSPPFERDQNVDYREIRPLVIKDVMVRAKKMR